MGSLLYHISFFTQSLNFINILKISFYFIFLYVHTYIHIKYMHNFYFFYKLTYFIYDIYVIFLWLIVIKWTKIKLIKKIINFVEQNHKLVFFFCILNPNEKFLRGIFKSFLGTDSWLDIVDDVESTTEAHLSLGAHTGKVSIYFWPEMNLIAVEKKVEFFL